MPKGKQGFQKGHKRMRTIDSYRNLEYRTRMGKKSDKWKSAMQSKMSGVNNPSYKGGRVNRLRLEA